MYEGSGNGWREGLVEVVSVSLAATRRHEGEGEGEEAVASLNVCFAQAR